MNDPNAAAYNNHHYHHNHRHNQASQLLHNNGAVTSATPAAAAAAAAAGISELEQMIASAATIGKRSESSNKRKKTKPKPPHNSNNAANTAVDATVATQQHAANTAQPPELDHQAVQKHLDDWLDNCLKDAPLTNSSSSEFLDNIQGAFTAPTQTHHHQQLQTNPSNGAAKLRINMNASTNAAAAALAAQLYGGGGGGVSAGGAKMFGIGGGPKLPETPTRISDPFSSYPKPQYMPMYAPTFGGQPPHFGSGHALNGPPALHAMSVGSNYMNGGSRQSNMNSDFSSLPPAVNMMNHGKDLRLDAQDILEGLEHRHFSDPCLAGASDDSKDSGNGPTTTTNRSPNSPKANHSGHNHESAKMLTTILEQIGALHDTNTKICRSLHENKVDIEALKHAPNWGLRHRRDSISGLSTHSQPLGYAAAFGTHSPAPTFHSVQYPMRTQPGMYTPGMLTDVVREVKDAARVREDALLSRVKALVEERSWMMGDSNAKLQRELEDLKAQIGQLHADRKDTHTHIGKLEDELKSLRTLLTHVLHTQASSYHHNGSNSAVSGPFYAPDSNPMVLVGRHQQQQQHPHQQSHQHQQQQRPVRHGLNLSYGTINTSNNHHDELDLAYGGSGSGAGSTGPDDDNGTDISPHAAPTNGCKYGGGVGGGGNAMDERMAQIVRDNVDLRSDLSSALESRKLAESKIESLENMVMQLQSSITHHGEVTPSLDTSKPKQQHQHTSHGGSSSNNNNSTHHSNNNNHSNSNSTHHSSRNSSFSEAHTSGSMSTVLKHPGGLHHSTPAAGSGTKTGGNNSNNHHHNNNNSSSGNSNTISLIGPVTDL